MKSKEAVYKNGRFRSSPKWQDTIQTQPSKEQKSYNLKKKANQQRPDQGGPYVGIIRHLKAVIKT